jgi:hypothetical protein
MLNNKYATTWTYYDRSCVYECHSGFLAVTKKYNTCIFLSLVKITVEEGTQP